MEVEENLNQVFGCQLLLDLYNCKDGVCDDLDLCYRFLDTCVDKLGMEKQAPPNIFRSDAVRFPDKAGLSGWVPLIESSIVIHTLSVKNFISIDVYCCKRFDNDKAKELCYEFFGAEKIEKQFIERGQDYYKTDTNYHTMMVNKADKKGRSEVKVTLKKKESSLISTE